MKGNKISWSKQEHKRGNMAATCANKQRRLDWLASLDLMEPIRCAACGKLKHAKEYIKKAGGRKVLKTCAQCRYENVHPKMLYKSGELIPMPVDDPWDKIRVGHLQAHALS